MLPIDLRRRRLWRRGEERCEKNALVLLIETAAQRQIVAHACERSRAAGIHPGMALSAARAALMSSNLVVAPHDPHRARKALRAMALWCHRFSPVVAEEDAEGICLDVTGCVHLFGGEQNMISRVKTAFKRLGFTTSVTIAPTFAAARAIARHGDAGDAAIGPGELKNAIQNLPVEAIGIEEETIAGLAEVNIRRVGDLLALPRAAVAARFGDQALGALDRALGRSREFIEPIRPVDPPRVERVFEGPCASLEAIGLACRETLAQLCEILAGRDLGVTEWSISLHRSDLPPLAIAIRHCAPSRDAHHLWGLLAPRLERAHLGFGVEGVVIAALGARRMRHAQQRWWSDCAPGGEARSAAADGLIDVLINRLGKDAVVRAETLQSHIPERAFALRSAIDQKTAPASANLCKGDRPTCLFSAPAIARVIALSPDGPVSRLEWGGAVHTLIACIGPERIKEEWWGERWRGECSLRDYFKVQDDRGRWMWIYRDHLRGEWFVHGVWA